MAYRVSSGERKQHPVKLGRRGPILEQSTRVARQRHAKYPLVVAIDRREAIGGQRGEHDVRLVDAAGVGEKDAQRCFVEGIPRELGDGLPDLGLDVAKATLFTREMKAVHLGRRQVVLAGSDAVIRSELVIDKG